MKIVSRRTFFTALVILCAIPAGASASGTLSLMIDNDLFASRDGHYTNGIGFIWIPDHDTPVPLWAHTLADAMPWLPENGSLRHGYAFGQSMFTPNDISLANPPATDRPYGGWLYGTFGVGRVEPERLGVFSITLGAVGPASFADESQKAVHHAIDSQPPQGWATQLSNEPGLVVRYEHGWRPAAHLTRHNHHWDLTSYIGGSLGNIFTYASTGMMLRFGSLLPDDFGPPRIQPGMFGTGEITTHGHFHWYTFVGVEGRGVARNIFLDGNTFHGSRSVDKNPWVGDLQIGFVMEWPSIRVSYTQVYRTREYLTQDHHDKFGALTISSRF